MVGSNALIIINIFFFIKFGKQEMYFLLGLQQMEIVRREKKKL